jgi:transglutaminase-like putative cysteine protease
MESIQNPFIQNPKLKDAIATNMRQLQQFPVFQSFKQRQEAIPLTETEDSLLLRVLVQALVIVGIIATDIAAESLTSWWAIPLSIAGAAFSWKRRRKRNIEAKFLIAIGMLIVLVVFLGNLIVNLGDSRLALANLLVQLQVLHSFDLPRRKDLGYSMVVGLILLGVAGTVSQTLAFAPTLIVFLAIALPTLVLDYRSRLGLESIPISFSRPSSTQDAQSRVSTYSPLSPGRYFLFLGTIILLGLAIFAIMPRFPGYQLQSFPVNSPADMRDLNFDSENRNIVNPGYVREGKAGTGEGQGTGTGAGEIDRTFYYGFNSRINQNLRGAMEPKIVLRVRSQAPGFWRVMSFDRYTGQGWEVSRENQLEDLKRPRWSYRFFISSPPTRGQTRQVIQSYTAVSELPNLIPALSYPKFVFFPTQEIAIDPEGSLRAPAGLSEGLTYTVISEVPYRDRTLLNQTPKTYPKRIANYYLEIPPAIRDKVRQKAEEILAKSPNPLTTTYEQTLFLAQYLKQNYQIQPELAFLEENEDLVAAFLFRYQGGYADHFSTVLTVMLRSLGIPARLTVGFAPGQFNPFTGFYVVRNTDAYALTEVYFADYGWFSFDPIPGHELIPPSFEEDQTFSVLKQLWNWVAGWLPSPVVSFFTILWGDILGGFFRILGWLWGFISGSLIGVLVGLIVAVVLGFLAWLGFKQMRSRLYRRRIAKLPPMERLYQQMLEILKVKGYPKHPAQTPLEYARLAYQHNPSGAEIIEEISQAYVRWRYGEQSQNLDYLRGQLKLLIRSLNRASQTSIRA